MAGDIPQRLDHFSVFHLSVLWKYFSVVTIRSYPKGLRDLNMNWTDNPQIAYEPELIPPLELMREEGVDILEEWFRWAEEWSMLLRFYGGISRTSAVLEIGCGLGRIAFPLRYMLSGEGPYDGFEICKNKVEFLERTFHRAHPNFRFVWADAYNTYYDPEGGARAADYRFPYPDDSFDIVFAASVFTHMAPETAENYFRESGRVLKPNGKCVFSFFLLDNYHPDRSRPSTFSRPDFDFDHHDDAFGKEFAYAIEENLEQITAYRSSLIERFARDAGLAFAQPPVPGFWSGRYASWISTQDLVILSKG